MMADEITKSYLLDSVAGWRASLMDKASFSKEKDGICLKKKPKNIKDETGAFGGLDLPTGIALDNYGNIYIVDTEGNKLLKYDLCQNVPVPLECLGGKGKAPREFDAPKGIAISSDNIYISDTNNHRIQVFSLKGLALRAIMGAVDEHGQPEPGTGDGEFNSPWDLAIDSKKDIYIVDRGNNRVQKFSKDGYFLKKFGEANLSNPEHIAIDKYDNIYVIDDKEYVQKFNLEGKYLGKVEYVEEAIENFIRPAITVDKAGRIHYKIEYPKYLYLFNRGLDKSEPKKGCSTILEGVIPGLFFEKSKLIIGVENLPKPDEYEEVYLTEGTFYSEALDSKTYKCQWHKILLEADFPLGTSIKVETYTSETEKDFLEVEGLPADFWQTNQVNSKNFLIQSPPGRYLWLKITFKGNVKETPVIKKIKILYPRVSYLQYLPRIYQEDPASKWFLERFLSIFQHFLSGFEDEISNISKYFDPTSTDKEFLPWLASWLALTLDEKWPEEKRRELIKKAHQLFRMRGTLRGLQEILEIHTGRKFPVLEHFRIRKSWLILGEDCILGCNSLLWGKEFSLGETTELGGFQLGNIEEPIEDPFKVNAHKFSLFIPLSYSDTEEKERTIRRIVELWKPAHTKYFLSKVEPKFRVGLQSMIGVDTIIGKYPVAILGDVSRLGKDSILGECIEERSAPVFVLNRNIRLNEETIIN